MRRNALKRRLDVKFAVPGSRIATGDITSESISLGIYLYAEMYHVFISSDSFLYYF
ncbi:TPA: hypothetical protein HH166_004001 [Escherichia coli]|nr:hypothetical protein [Escherichia coli]HAH4711867.1 hypothetical protein [Escherichia coli]HAH5053253.1 hypothetical protein [Escherichia coli]HAH7575849.1 hypothetical protein [Escherichia coli]